MQLNYFHAQFIQMYFTTNFVVFFFVWWKKSPGEKQKSTSLTEVNGAGPVGHLFLKVPDPSPSAKPSKMKKNANQHEKIPVTNSRTALKALLQDYKFVTINVNFLGGFKYRSFSLFCNFVFQASLDFFYFSKLYKQIIIFCDIRLCYSRIRILWMYLFYYNSFRSLFSRSTNILCIRIIYFLTTLLFSRYSFCYTFLYLDLTFLLHISRSYFFFRFRFNFSLSHFFDLYFYPYSIFLKFFLLFV